MNQRINKNALIFSSKSTVTDLGGENRIKTFAMVLGELNQEDDYGAQKNSHGLF